MPHYLARGDLPKKRFTILPKADGRMHYEHLISTEQLTPESSLLYRLHAPSRLTRVEPMAPLSLETPGRPVGHGLLFRADRLESGGDYLDARTPVLFGENRLVFYIARPDRPMTRFYCNVLADELVLVVKGAGVLETVFGDIRYRERDLIHVPRHVTVRWIPDPGPQELAILESAAPVRPPKGFIKANGQFNDAASYHERDLRTPAFRPPLDEAGDFEVVMKSGLEQVCCHLGHHPYDVAGWDGCYYPYALNLADYEPLSGRIFLLVDRFQVFASDEMALVAVTPRLLPDIPNASPANPFHSNLLCDEMMFRYAGDTGATETATGTITLTPRGAIHGPKPGFEDAPKRSRIDWWGLLMETTLTLSPTVQAVATQDDSYARTMLESQLIRT